MPAMKYPLKERCAMILKKSITFFVASLYLCLGAWADTGSVLFLYTSDMHDYIKPGPDNLGGLPYVAGYIASVRQQRDDILVLDGGDVMEKGDMVAYKTQSRIMYEAMGKIGYDAGAVGNHDLEYGLEHLRECSRLAGMTHLCLNYYDEAGKPYFSASKIFDVKGTKIGIIGLTVLKGGPFLDLPECGARLAAEAARLKSEGVHLVAVIAHIGSRDLAKLSPYAPEVALFFGGHNHEILVEPRVVPETGALILMAGQYARYVVHMDVTVDLEKGRIANYTMQAVEMAHDRVRPDEEMLAWIKAEEARVVPNAAEVVGRADEVVQANAMAKIAAEAFKWYGKVDAAFCHTGQIMRSSLSAGEIDQNALFRTGGQRGETLLTAELTGAQIQAYLEGLAAEKRGQTEWAGFQGKVVFDREADTWKVRGDLDLNKTYKVIVPQLEWDTRFMKVAQATPLLSGIKKPDKAAFTFVDAVAAYIKRLTDEGETLDAHVKAIR